MNNFETEKQKNIEELKQLVKDIENDQVESYQVVAFRKIDNGVSTERQVIGDMDPYRQRGVNESLAEEAKKRAESERRSNDFADLLGMFADSPEEDD